MKKLILLVLVVTIFPLVAFGQTRPHWLQIEGRPVVPEAAEYNYGNITPNYRNSGVPGWQKEEPVNPLYITRTSSDEFRVGFVGHQAGGGLQAGVVEALFTTDSGGFLNIRDLTVGEATSTWDFPIVTTLGDISTGTFNTDSTPNHYATEVGSIVTTEVYGSEIIFHHLSDDRGGIWDFWVNGQFVKSISTNNKTLGVSNISRFEQVIVSGLPVVNPNTGGRHRITGVFAGDDPRNPPSGGAGTSRGWLKHGSKPTFTASSYLRPLDPDKDKLDLLSSGSIDDFALTISPDSGTSPNWVPTHSGNVTTKANNVQVYLDGRFLFSQSNGTWSAVSSFTQYLTGSSVTIFQTAVGHHSSSPAEDLVKISRVIEIEPPFIRTYKSFRFLEDTHVGTGYLSQWGFKDNGNDAALTTPGGLVTPLITPATNTQSSFPVTTNSLNLMSFWRSGRPVSVSISTNSVAGLDFGDPSVFMTHRTDGINKIYFRGISDTVVPSGTILKNNTEIKILINHNIFGVLDQ